MDTFDLSYAERFEAQYHQHCTCTKRAGQIGIRRPDPVMFLEYWQDPGATLRKYAGDYLLTGDIASQDESGYFRFAGRDDDLITSGAYRIGPQEIENV